MEAIGIIDQYQEQHNQVMARIALKLEMSAKEMAALEASDIPPMSPTLGNLSEVSRSRMLGIA